MAVTSSQHTPPSSARLAVTEALRSYGDGKQGAFHELVNMVYEELRRLAHVQVRRRGSHLETTALVNELYLKLASRSPSRFNDRGHFFAACATAMRHILLDVARATSRQKRGGGEVALEFFDEVWIESPSQAESPANERRWPDAEWLVQIDQILTALTAQDPRIARVFECRYFAGYTSIETAQILGISKRTADREWQRACGWIRLALAAEGTDAAGDAPT